MHPPCCNCKATVVRAGENPDWTPDELAAAHDRPLAAFYFSLDWGDRHFFEGMHVDIHGDFRKAAVS